WICRLASSPASRLASPGIPQRRIDPVDIRLDLRATALINDLSPTHGSDVGQLVSGRAQGASDAVDAFTENDLDAFRALVENDQVHGLSAFGDAHGDFFVVHGLLCLVRRALRPRRSAFSGSYSIRLNQSRESKPESKAKTAPAA